VLILNEPTRGIDVGAKAEVHALIRETAAQGVAVLMISSELPEILAVSDRIVVMAAGRVTGEMPAHDATEESVLALAFADELIMEHSI
jgi:ABC-type sugar transport system ATPase subunit